MATVVLPKDQRNIYLHFLVQDGLIELHNNSKTKNKKLLFVSEDNNDEVILELKEIDFKELAYVYMFCKNTGAGFTKCQKCGRTIKQSKTRPRKYCEECSKYESIGDKLVTCVDCGKEFTIDSLSRRIRCRSCNEEYQKERNRIKNMAYRDRNKNA